jgi:hypothetical protein
VERLACEGWSLGSYPGPLISSVAYSKFGIRAGYRALRPDLAPEDVPTALALE